MKTVKRVLCIILSIAMLSGLVVTASARDINPYAPIITEQPEESVPVLEYSQ